MRVEELRSVFEGWKAQAVSEDGIEFKEAYNPAFDPNDDYRMIYQASFEPTTLDKARIEFWLTDSGHVAVGIETYDRIARRLGVKPIRHGFAGGHEPKTVSKDGLKILFGAVTRGKMFIVVRNALRIATSAKIYMTAADCDAIARSGYGRSDWISPMSDVDAARLSSWFGTVIDYQPW